ncbi:MAG: HD domain-containing protein [Spirochaetaceae bacterium]|nr:HD domain-containing protein [Spirochaetaceae bacterium]MCF7949896.1 HD domain-containing protein [Spirochaetia bacterium]MCF7952283.1 HD domain-containing protein [Spirochaetaceae bacterium]
MRETGLEEAIELALEAHRGHTQRNGAPYILHSLYVMQQVNGEVRQTAAVVHDVLEDSPLTLDDLRSEGFCEQVVSLVDALSRRAEETYEQYIQRLAKNPSAIPIKLADLRHNMDALRLVDFTPDDGLRFQRYHKAYRQLERRYTEFCLGETLFK